MDGSSELETKIENADQNTNRHQCDVCELSFKAKTSLYFHKMTLHKTLTIKPEVKEEICKLPEKENDSHVKKLGLKCEVCLNRFWGRKSNDAFKRVL